MNKLNTIQAKIEEYKNKFYPEDIAGKINPDSFAQLQIDWIQKTLIAQQNRLIDEVLKIVGEDENNPYAVEGDPQEFENGLKQEMRVKLEELKKSL